MKCNKACGFRECPYHSGYGVANCPEYRGYDAGVRDAYEVIKGLMDKQEALPEDIEHFIDEHFWELI